MDDSIKKAYANKYFRDLDTETRKTFWNYPLMIIEIDSKATRDDIITMFNRLNLTDYNLNDQEKRNSVSGEFAALAREISNNPLWDERRLFTGPDVKRMKDVEFCASLLLLYRKRNNRSKLINLPSIKLMRSCKSNIKMQNVIKKQYVLQ